jgi:plasmid stabilization system protein ParE
VRFRFKVARRAEREIRVAAEWWLANRADAALVFAEDLDSALDLIEEFPNAGERYATRDLTHSDAFFSAARSTTFTTQ